MLSSLSQRLLLVATVLATTPCVLAASLPIVDLKTPVHQAILNETGSYYSFNNIPYAEPPVGSLRFKKPTPIVTVDRTVNDGKSPRACPQGSAGWFAYSIPLVLQTIADSPYAGTPSGISNPTPDISEDCLQLDVVVPTSIYNARNTNKAGAPVLVWIHGGAYVSGYKNAYSPAGLIAESTRSGRSGIVFVEINYRLGLFGFPPRLPGMDGIASNAGLYDQRLALQWVKDNISKFGGDPNCVTVMGESAGAGSIVAQMLAFGGARGSAPFQRAMLQSPALKPGTNAELYAEIYLDFLSQAGVSSIQEAKSMSSEKLQSINSAMVANSSFGTATFAPNIDGTFIPQEPGQMLLSRNIDTSVELIIAHNLDEGLMFTDPRVDDESGFTDFVGGLIPTLGDKIISLVSELLYPEDYSGSQPYTTPTERVSLAIGEMIVSCYAFGLNLAYGGSARGYQFSIFPGMHSQDLAFTFWNGATTDGWGLPLPSTVAQKMQGWFVDFTLYGSTGTSSVKSLPKYGFNAQVMNISLPSKFNTVSDPAANTRCGFLLAL